MTDREKARERVTTLVTAPARRAILAATCPERRESPALERARAALAGPPPASELPVGAEWARCLCARPGCDGRLRKGRSVTVRIEFDRGRGEAAGEVCDSCAAQLMRFAGITS